MGTDSFENVWSQTLRGISATGAVVHPTPEMKDCLSVLYQEASRRPVDEASLRDALRAVLEYLASPTGRSHDNFWVVSNFIMPGDDYWAESWHELPAPYPDMFNKMGHELWQSSADPEWTRAFDALPEQLLAKLDDAGLTRPPS